MAKGSFTVFVALIMVSVMTLLFTMAECIRIYELHDFAQEYTDMAVESAFSEYNPYLWTNYKILAIDLGYGTENEGPAILEGKTVTYCSFNSDIEAGVNYARLNPTGCQVENYALLTDGNGQGVVMLGVKAAKDNMAAQVIDSVQGKIDEVNGIEKVPVEEKAKEGKKSLEDAKTQKSQSTTTESTEEVEVEEVEDDPLDAFEIMRESVSKGVLSTVVSTDGLSDAKMDIEKMPSHRSLNSGTMEIESGNAITDKALFVDYLLTNYSYYGHDLKHDGVKYELEYIVSGCDSDTQALARVVEEILLIREGANYAAIMASPTLQAEALKIATSLAGFTLNPVIIDAVQCAVIAAWAYIESILDLRLLLAGGKVPIIKTTDQWTSYVWHLSSYLDVNTKAKQCETGITYKEYLMGLLAVHSNSKLSLRACDVMEDALSHTEDYKDVKLDNMIFAADFTMEYSGDEMFLSLLSPSDLEGGYAFTKTKSITY